MSSPSITITNTQSDEVNSYYLWVYNRVHAANPSRNFGGIIDARDWPSKQAEVNTFYLGISGDRPSKFGTPTSRVYTFSLDWVWLVQGSDIQVNQQGPNRTKYRLNEVMKGELLNGSYPQYCEKKAYGLDVSGNLVGTSFYPSENVWWNAPSFTNRTDKNTGTLYGSGQVMLSAFSPVILS